MVRDGGPAEIKYRSYVADADTHTLAQAPAGWAVERPVLYLNEEISGASWDVSTQVWQLERKREAKRRRVRLLNQYRRLALISAVVQKLVADGWRMCAEFGCLRLLPPEAHRNKHFCSEHGTPARRKAMSRDGLGGYVEIPGAQLDPESFLGFLRQ
jgi:hypothetical protein